MMALHRLYGALAMIVVPATALAEPPADNPSFDRAVDSLLQLVDFRGVALSPDGKHVAWVQAQADKAGPSPNRSILYVADVGARASAPKRVTASPDATWYNERDPAWSPDGRTLAFLSDAAQKGQLQLYVADLDSGRVQKKTDVKGSLDQPRFSPHVRSTAILCGAGAEGALGPLEAGPRQTGLIAETVVDQRIALIDAGRGGLRALSPAGLYIYEYDWSP